MISTILTVFNQQDIIKIVVESILKNISYLTTEFIIVFDGCTDNSEAITRSVTSSAREDLKIKYLYAPDVFEVKANNLGLKAATNPFSLLIQDDMVIEEEDFDYRLLKPFIRWGDVFAVTARTAEDNTIINNQLEHVNRSGRETNQSRDIFAVRDSVNRGPLLLKNSILKELNYLDEDFAPLHLDDHDLTIRAYKAGKYVSGSYMIKYRSDLNWGSTRKGNSVHIGNRSWAKNAELIKSRHYDSLMGEKHSEDRILYEHID